MSQDAAASFLIKHAVVIHSVGNHVALIAGDDAGAQVRPMLAAIVQAAVPAGTDFYLHAQLKISQIATTPDDEAVVLQRAIGHAGKTTISNAPVVRASFPAR